jgi:hypothetical protein
MNRDFYARLYEAEWERMEQLQSSLSTPLGVLVVLGTGLTVLVQQFKSSEADLNAIFWPLFMCSCIAFAVAAYRLFRSFHGYVYSRIPLPSQLRKYHEGLRAHYTALGLPGVAEREMDQYLLDRYIEAGDINSVHNVNRDVYLQKANRALVAAFVAASASAIPYAISVRSTAPQPQQVILAREANANERAVSGERGGAARAAQTGAATQHRVQNRAQGSPKR